MHFCGIYRIHLGRDILAALERQVLQHLSLSSPPCFPPPLSLSRCFFRKTRIHIHVHTHITDRQRRFIAGGGRGLILNFRSDGLPGVHICFPDETAGRSSWWWSLRRIRFMWRCGDRFFQAFVAQKWIPFRGNDKRRVRRKFEVSDFNFLLHQVDLHKFRKWLELSVY